MVIGGISVMKYIFIWIFLSLYFFFHVIVHPDGSGKGCLLKHGNHIIFVTIKVKNCLKPGIAEMLFPFSCIGMCKSFCANSKLHVKSLADGSDHVHIHLASKRIHISLMRQAIQPPGCFLKRIHTVGNKIVVFFLIKLLHQI